MQTQHRFDIWDITWVKSTQDTLLRVNVL